MAEIKTEILDLNSAESHDCICTISQCYFDDPVVTPCQHFFERDELITWEKKQKEENSELEHASCPLCKHPITSFTKSSDKKLQTDKLLYTNLNQLPSRYLNASVVSRFHKFLQANTLNVALDIFREHPHLIFFANQQISVIKSLIFLPLDKLQLFVDVLEKTPNLAKFALTWQNSVGTSGILYSFLTDIEKFEYIKGIMGNELSHFSKFSNCLQLAAMTKNVSFFNYLLELFSDDIFKFLLFRRAQDGKNALMVAAAQSSKEIVNCILNLFKNSTKDEVTKLVSNEMCPDILACAVSNSNEGFAIYSQLHSFLEEKLGHNELVLFKKFNKRRSDFLQHTRLQKTLASQDQALQKLQQDITVLKKQRHEHRFRSSIFLSQPWLMSPESNTENHASQPGIQVNTNQSSGEFTPTPPSLTTTNNANNPESNTAARLIPLTSIFNNSPPLSTQLPTSEIDDEDAYPGIECTQQ